MKQKLGSDIFSTAGSVQCARVSQQIQLHAKPTAHVLKCSANGPVYSSGKMCQENVLSSAVTRGFWVGMTVMKFEG